MKKYIGAALVALSLLLSFGDKAHAFASKPPTEGQPPKNGQAALDFALNLAITYAKTDPKYAAILNTLGIKNAEDIKGFLQGNKDGTNFQQIIARLAMLEAQKDPQAKQMLADIGILTEQDLRKYLKDGQIGIDHEAIFEMALKQAESNTKYAVWLDRLNINSIEDIRLLAKGTGEDGNLMSLIAVVALYYVESNPEYAEYAVYIRLLMAAYGIVPGEDGTGRDDTSDDDIIDLGAHGGMTVGEVKAIRRLQ